LFVFSFPFFIFIFKRCPDLLISRVPGTFQGIETTSANNTISVSSPSDSSSNADVNPYVLSATAVYTSPTLNQISNNNNSNSSNTLASASVGNNETIKKMNSSTNVPIKISGNTNDTMTGNKNSTTAVKDAKVSGWLW
jgi:hypothetical protein